MANGSEAFAFFHHAGIGKTFSGFVAHFENIGKSGSVKEIVTVSLGNTFNFFAVDEMLFAGSEEFVNLGFFLFTAGEAVSGTVEVGLAFTHGSVFGRFQAGVDPIIGIFAVEISVDSPGIFKAVFFVFHHGVGFAVAEFFKAGSHVKTSFNAESDQFMFGYDIRDGLGCAVSAYKIVDGFAVGTGHFHTEAAVYITTENFVNFIKFT